MEAPGTRSRRSGAPTVPIIQLTKGNPSSRQHRSVSLHCGRCHGELKPARCQKPTQELPLQRAALSPEAPSRTQRSLLCHSTTTFPCLSRLFGFSQATQLLATASGAFDNPKAKPHRPEEEDAAELSRARADRRTNAAQRKPANTLGLIISKPTSKAPLALQPPRNALCASRFEASIVLLSKPKAFSMRPKHYEEWSCKAIPVRWDTEHGRSEQRAGTHATLCWAKKIK